MEERKSSDADEDEIFIPTNIKPYKRKREISDSNEIINLTSLPLLEEVNEQSKEEEKKSSDAFKKARKILNPTIEERRMKEEPSQKPKVVTTEGLYGRRHFSLEKDKKSSSTASAIRQKLASSNNSFLSDFIRRKATNIWRERRISVPCR